MGYETMTFLENMGFVTTLLLVLAIRQVLGILFSYMEKIYCCKKCLKSRRHLLVSSPSESFNMWARFLLMTYFEFVISCCAGAQIGDFLPEDMTFAVIVSLCLSYIFTLVVIAFPIVISVTIWFRTSRGNDFISDCSSESEDEYRPPLNLKEELKKFGNWISDKFKRK